MVINMSVNIRKRPVDKIFEVNDIVKGFDNCRRINGRVVNVRDMNFLGKCYQMIQVETPDSRLVWGNSIYFIGVQNES